MNKYYFGLALVLVLISQAGFTRTLPENTMYRLDRYFGPNRAHGDFDQDLEERKVFYKLVTEVYREFSPIVKKFRSKLVIEANWEDPNVGAYADQFKNGKEWVWRIAVSGGIFRRPEITRDAFTMVLCHELGHHLGGYPFFSGGEKTSVEGQADYFASMACARQLWKRQTSLNRKFQSIVEPKAYRLCRRVWSNYDDAALCFRVAIASRSLATMFSVLRDYQKHPRTLTKDLSTVSQTLEDHPEPQCRHDTMMQGALCKKSFSLREIPGLKEYLSGSLKGAEASSMRSSCDDRSPMVELGERPACWFKTLRR